VWLVFVTLFVGTEYNSALTVW